MNDILFDLPGVLCHIDDILVFGTAGEEHDSRLFAVLERIKAAGITLNSDKCQFSQPQITFLGHVINRNGISPDPKKTTAILSMKPPSSVTELRRFMEMVNQMGKFSPNIVHISKPLRELLSTKNAWTWTVAQEESFNKLKEELSSSRVLALYDISAKTKISADASGYGLGAVLLQQQADTKWRPVAFASRSMNDSERRYAQIEKEALALTWALERFSEYVLGKVICLETDHKPLITLLGQKSLDLLPPRILRFRLRVMRFQYSIHHVPGKSLYTTDTLSRAPMPESTETPHCHSTEVEQFVQAIITGLPASTDRLEVFSKAQANDSICSKLIEFFKSGWPSRNKLDRILKDYWRFRANLTLSNSLLLYQSRIVIPSSMRQEILAKIHHGHQGIHRCRLRVATSVWWPGVTTAIERFVQSCPT